MTNYIKKTLLIAAFSSINIYAPYASAYDFVIDDFRFGMSDPSFSSWSTAGGANPGSIVNGVPVPQLIGPYGTLTENVYQGSNSTQTLVPFYFFGSNTYIYTALTNQGSSNTGAGTISGGPVPTIDFNTMTADMSSWFVRWTTYEFNQGNNNNHAACASHGLAYLLSDIATVTNTGNKKYSISWNSCISTVGSPFISQIGFWKLDVSCDISCPDVDAPETLGVIQNSISGIQTVGTNSGNVVISSPKGVNPANTTYTWTVTPAVFADSDSDQGTFTFNPSGVTPGIYTVSHTYLDTTLDPDHIGSGTIQIRVATGLVTDFVDTDGDGVSDTYDSNSDPLELQATLNNSSTYQLATDTGLLALGNTAFCVSSGAQITLDNITNHADTGCAAVINSQDSSIEQIGVGGFYNFRVTGLTSGETANIVIPLTEAIPSHATFRNYTVIGGWVRFTVDTTDALASAPATSTGVCPAPNDAAYTSGLTAGHTCVRITIVDGGENDPLQDGIVTIQGGVAKIQSGVEAHLASGCSMTGNASANDHAEWLLLAGFIGILGWYSLSRRKA